MTYRHDNESYNGKRKNFGRNDTNEGAVGQMDFVFVGGWVSGR